MKTIILVGMFTATVLLAGCGKPSSPVADAPSPTAAETNRSTANLTAPAAAHPVAATPVTQPVLAAWQEGDHAQAINNFLAADWNARPIFPNGMALNLSEGQFQSLTDADRELKAKELEAQLGLMKQLASAVAQAGRDAAAKGDVPQARKCFAALKQCGVALDDPSRMKLVQMVGGVMKKMADAEMLKLGQ